MNYSELTANIQDICETTFTADQLAMFVEQAEEKIYNTVRVPTMRQSYNTTLAAAANSFAVPDGFLYVLSLALEIDFGTDDGEYITLIPKDYSFLREAYPTTTQQGTPKYYAVDDEADPVTILFAPALSGQHIVRLEYAAYPASIVTASTTWLGDNASSALLNGALLEAARFMQQDADVIQNYEKMYLQSIALLKGQVDGRLRTDTFRTGQVMEAVN